MALIIGVQNQKGLPTITTLPKPQKEMIEGHNVHLCLNAALLTSRMLKAKSPREYKQKARSLVVRTPVRTSNH